MNTATVVPTEQLKPGVRVGSILFDHCNGGAQIHDDATKRSLVIALADLLSWSATDDIDAMPARGDGWLVVPSDTLVGRHEAASFGIRDAKRTFGGVVPHAFIAIKAITHPLVHAAAGAVEAGKRLLSAGAVCLREPGGAGGQRSTWRSRVNLLPS